jgi:glycosyltransferase involved in cell wall biosynthesis
VTRFHVEASNGGLWYEDYPTFAAALDFLCKEPEKAAVIGEQGREYVRTEFDPDTVKAKLNDFFWPLLSVE